MKLSSSIEKEVAKKFLEKIGAKKEIEQTVVDELGKIFQADEDINYEKLKQICMKEPGDDVQA